MGGRAKLLAAVAVTATISAPQAHAREGDDVVFDEAMIVGRVYCDDDRDGEQDEGEAGLMGARVFVETGSYAITDSAGLYHLTQIGPGSHMVELDEASLAGGAPLGEVSRVLYLTAAAPESVDFGVACSREVVTAGDRRITVRRAGEALPDALAPVKQQVTVTGSVEAMIAAVDGAAIPLPTASVGFRGDRFELSAVSPSGAAPAEWVLGLNRHERDGALAEPMIRTWQGIGAPPARVAWDGKDADGNPLAPGLYSAQLAVRSSGEGVLAISARAPFGVQPQIRPTAPIAEQWRGALFSGSARKPTATAELKRRTAELAAQMGPGDTIEIEVHADGAGSKLAALARSQREAELIAQLLAGAGVAADRVTAHGRGNLDQLASPATRAGRDKNRRVTVAVTRAAPTEQPFDVPGRILDAASAKVNGRPVAVGEDGHFAAPARRPVCVELIATDGRLATGCEGAPRRATAPARGATGRRVAVTGDLSAGTLTVDGAPIDAGLLRADIALSSSAGGVLELQPAVPPDVEVSEWSVAVRSEAGELVHRAGEQGAPPATVTWDGSAALQSGKRYSYELAVTAPGGASATSAPHWFLFDPPPAREDVPELAMTGRLFRSYGGLTRSTRSHLSLIATTMEGPDRYFLSVRVSARALRPASNRDKAIALRRAAVVAYLDGVGVTADRYELAVDASDGDDDELRVAIARPPEPARPSTAEVRPSAVINDVPQPLDRLRLDASLTVEPGTQLLVDLVFPTGQRAHFAVTPEPAPEPPPPAAAETRPPPRAADLTVTLPREGAHLGAPRVPVQGKTDPGNYVTINGERAHVRADGRFDLIATLPPGKQTLKIVAVDAGGNTAEIAWPLDIAASDVFAMAMVEGVAASASVDGGDWDGEGAWLDGITDETSLEVGPLRLHGRAAAYVKARLRDFEITARVDTATVGDDQPFFEQLVDPARDYAVYGDSATEVRDAEARGKLYLHATDGEGTSATIGNIHGRLRGGDLLRFDRTVYGAAISLDGAHLTDDHAIDVDAFSAFEETGLSHDINLFRSTGGSLYYLRNDQVVEGSEQVRVVVRDRDTDLILTERVAVRDVDYVIDYPAGRLLFTEPPASVADAGWMLDNLGASTTPLDGHPVFVEVQYEHRGGGLAGAPTGAYVRDTMYGHLSVGAGVVGEAREGGDYRLWGADASYRFDERSSVRVEVGASRNADADNFLSTDGGMTFDRFGIATTEYSYGWKLGADLGLTDSTSASVHAQSLERGFSSNTTVLEQGHTKFGGRVVHRLSGTDRVAGRIEADVAELDSRTHIRTGVQWRRSLADWTFTVEGGHELLRDIGTLDANRVGVGGVAARKLSDQLTVRAGQEVQTALTDGDPLLADEFSDGVTSIVGADLKAAPGVLVSADEYLRWNGDHATRVGLQTRVGDTASMYVREQLGTRRGDFVSTTIVGAADRFGASGGGRTYGEYQLENGALGQRNRAVLGLGHRWEVSRGLRLGLGFEHQQVFGGFTPDGMPVGDYLRDVVHGQVDFVRLDRLKAGGRVELRWDDTETDERWQVVAGVGADVRATADLTVFGRGRILHTEDLGNQKLPLQTEAFPDTFTAARHLEMIAGWTYRPPRARWLDVLSQYAYQIEQRPTDEAGGAPEARSHVASLAPAASLPLRFQLSGKLAWKRTRLATPIDAGGALVTENDALLWLARLAYRVYGRWEVAGEYRRLQLWRTIDPDETRSGALFEAAYHVVRRIRLGVGYNFSRFSDNELGDLERDAHGLFVRVIGTY